MKKIAAGATATVFAVAGLSAMTIAPAAAAPYENCADAYAAGEWKIPNTSPNFTPGLDGDGDGFGCDDPDYMPAPDPYPVVPPVSPQPPVGIPEVDYLPENGPWAYDNCTDARAAGAVNIPAGAPGYGTHLDRDLDGIGCETDGAGNITDDGQGGGVVDPVPADDQVGWDGSQVEQMPAGGADTGVPVEKSAMGSQQVGLSALALAAFTGSFLLLRRSVKA